MSTKKSEKKSETVNVHSATFVTKVTTKLAVAGKKKADIPGTKMTLAAVVRKYSEKETEHGTAMKLQGEFQLDCGGGNVYRSNVAYVPRVLESYIENAVLSVDEKDLAQHGVAFMVKIEAKEDESSATGYVWAFQQLAQAGAPESALDRLLLTVDEKTK